MTPTTWDTADRLSSHRSARPTVLEHARRLGRSAWASAPGCRGQNRPTGRRNQLPMVKAVCTRSTSFGMGFSPLHALHIHLLDDLQVVGLGAFGASFAMLLFSRTTEKTRARRCSCAVGFFI